MDDMSGIAGIVDNHMVTNAASSIGGMPTSPPGTIAPPSIESRAADYAAGNEASADKDKAFKAISGAVSAAGASLKSGGGAVGGTGIPHPGMAQMQPPPQGGGPAPMMQAPSFAPIQASPVQGIQMTGPPPIQPFSPPIAMSDVRTKFNITPAGEDLNALLNSVYQNVVRRKK